ncbi:hypothetical protein QZH41_007913 [Actinostola sp. cb2023]|nr:hypothetical protein QZH41_007913 [Actinostola sp. cb2023]
MVSVKLGEQYLDLPLIIVDEKGPPLLGRTWLQKLKLPWKEIFAVRKGHSEEPLLTEILNEHEDLFNTEPGCLKDFKAKLQIEENTNPIFCKARPLPFSMKKRVEEELSRLENNGVIRKVSHSEWATPVVPVIKPSGAIRLCGDYKTTLNTVLKMDRYPLPLVDEIFANLAGGQKFTKLDLSEAYHQLCLDEESQKLTTINTHCGLYEYLYLPYGVNSAVGIFQCAIESTMKGLPGISVYMDDILVTGKDDSEHLSNLQGALTRLQEKGLKLQKSKCKFLLSEVEYLGFKISGDGIQPTESKVRAIREAPHPNNVSELRSFLGMVNYYARFLPNLAHQLSPMYDLLKKDTKWTWERNQQSAFKKIKELMSEDTLLEHYDANAEIVLECDASSTGVGAVLKQRTSSDKLKPVVFASRRLTAAERGYAQIDREALEIVFGVKKFRQYLLGRNFTLLTDHQPLVKLFGENKGIPQLAAARIKRWALILSAYRYQVEYITSKENACADYLSRAPILDLPTQDETLEDEVLTIATTLPKDIALSAKTVAIETRTDKILCSDYADHSYQIGTATTEASVDLPRCFSSELPYENHKDNAICINNEYHELKGKDSILDLNRAVSKEADILTKLGDHVAKKEAKPRTRLPKESDPPKNGNKSNSKPPKDNNNRKTDQKKTEDNTEAKKLVDKYADVFKGLGCLEGHYHIKVDSSVLPVVHLPRKVPFAIKD